MRDDDGTVEEEGYANRFASSRSRSRSAPSRRHRGDERAPSGSRSQQSLLTKPLRWSASSRSQASPDLDGDGSSGGEKSLRGLKDCPIPTVPTLSTRTGAVRYDGGGGSEGLPPRAHSGWITGGSLASELPGGQIESGKRREPLRPSSASVRDSPVKARHPARDRDDSAEDASVEAQRELYGQLQDVVVKLSKNAVQQTRNAAHRRQQLDAYAVLVKEQDGMIDALRQENARLQREKDSMLEHRRAQLRFENDRIEVLGSKNSARAEQGYAVHGSVADDAHRTPVSSPLSERKLDTLIRKEYAKVCGPKEEQPALERLTASTLKVLRSLVAQLHEERARSLAVEEQCSQLLEDQQSAGRGQEERLGHSSQRHERSFSGPHTSRVAVRATLATSPRPLHCRAPGIAGGSAGTSPLPQSAGASVPSHSSVQQENALDVKRSSSAPPPAMSWPDPPSTRDDASRTRSSRDPNGLVPGTQPCEDADAILADIRQRYNL